MSPVVTRGSPNGSPVNKDHLSPSIKQMLLKSSVSNDDSVLKLDKSKKKIVGKRKGNLDQSQIDDPTYVKGHKADMITEFLMISNDKTSMDAKWLEQNKVSHIINAAGSLIKNVFDPKEMEDKEVKNIVEGEGLKQTKFYGKMKYLTISNWSEHKMDLKFEECLDMFEFIEDAATIYSSCLVVSTKNKCSTVVISIIYLMQKFKWDVHRCLEFINARKSDVEITMKILKKL